MQNYLHSYGKKSKFGRIPKVLFILLSSVALISLCRAMLCGDSAEKSTVSPMYLSSFEDNGVKQVAQKTVDDFDTDEKMNNTAVKYSKNSEEKHINSGVYIPRNYVVVLDKYGNGVKMELEEYVLGCLLGEMPLSFNSQALMAQCVAIRSFTVNKMLEGSKHLNADVCMNPSCCQNYVDKNNSGYSHEKLQYANEAVNATRGVVAVSENLPINAVYHASSKARTRDSADVWGGEVEYLKSVMSPAGEAEIYTNNYKGGGGHGVGMSQQGANILAENGFSFADIIRYYYSGVSLDFVELQ